MRYLQEGFERDARARREVIVSAGTVNSPQLLMLSGIGPAEQLRRHGIEVVVDAPMVGRGLQDHPICLPEWRTPTVVNLWEEVTPANLMLWQQEGRGPMASSGAEAGGFARTHRQLPAPDVQYGMLPGPAPDPEPSPPSRRGVATIVIATDVRSRGQITLRSADLHAKPLIDPDYLSDEADLDVLVAGLRQAREIANCRPLTKLVAGEHAPGEHVDGDALWAWVRSHVMTAFHPTSTCAMGGDPAAVCDPELRVRGLTGLRIVDASVLPAVPRGNTNAPTIAVAERAADLIRGTTPQAPSAPWQETLSGSLPR